MARVRKIENRETETVEGWCKELEQGDLLMLGTEVCVRTDLAYDKEGAVVSIASGTAYYLGGCEHEYTPIPQGESFEVTQ